MCDCSGMDIVMVGALSDTVLPGRIRPKFYPTKTCLGIGTIVIICFYGFSLFTFELVCVTTAVALSLSLALISSIPTMIDLYCNCHYLIGLLGWMNITSNILQLGRFHHNSELKSPIGFTHFQ